MSDAVADLPDEWEVRTVEELAEPKGIAYGVLKPGPQSASGVPMLRVSDVRDGRVDATNLYMISPELDAEYRRTKLRGGEVVVSIQGSVGRVAIVPDELAGANVSRTLAIIRPRDPNLAAWIHRALEAPSAQAAMREVIGGTTRDSLNLRDLRRIELPVPPEPVRSQVLQLVESSESMLTSSSAHLSTARQALERFRRAVLAAACSGRLTAPWRAQHKPARPDIPAAGGTRPKQLRALAEFDVDDIPEEWRWVQVNDVLPAAGIFDGPFGSNLKSSDYTESGARVIRLENIGHLKFIDSKKTYVSESKYGTLLRHAVYPGDVVFSSFVEDRIRVCQLPETLEERSLAKADCFTLRPTRAIRSDYLTLQLAAPRSHRLLAGSVHGATRPRVNTTAVRGLPIPLCTPEEQAEIVRRHNTLTALAAAIEARIEAGASRVDRSLQALLAKAFRGELLTD